jgi:hypothetical protein
VLGIRGVTRILGRRGGGNAEEQARHAAVVEKIERLWSKAKEPLFYGRFMDNVGLAVSRLEVLAKVYSADNEVAVPLWNTAAEALSCEIGLDLKALGRPAAKVVAVTSVDGGEAVPFKLEGNIVRSQMKLAPHDIGILSIKTK